MESDIRDDFQCVICLGVLVSPVFHEACRKYFCSTCINQFMRNSHDCPYCRGLLSSSSVLPDPNLSEQISITEFTCNCGAKMPYSGYNNHMGECTSIRALIKHAVETTEKPPVPVVNRWTFKCPSCDQRNLDRQGLLDHYSQRHRGKSGVCPICSAMPWGDPNYVSSNLNSHLQSRHKYDTDTYTDYSMDDDAILQKVLQDSLHNR
ncbi:RNF166 [Blepharisma stoltei]|uniref:RING-type domain-containing protein n=1 Tax=Blepharisma stoltei TaxID=1481888 RepID=A0AAU9IBP6_9CILI|nr:unnamed protein product [Blepharisma stoltei]